MTISKERKTEVIGEHQKSDADTGSPEVQIAILTERINGLTEHMRTHRKDFASTARSAGSCQPSPTFAGLCAGRGSSDVISISSENWAFESSPTEPRSCEDGTARLACSKAARLLARNRNASLAVRWDTIDLSVEPLSPFPIRPISDVGCALVSDLRSFDCSHAPFRVVTGTVAGQEVSELLSL